MIKQINRDLEVKYYQQFDLKDKQTLAKIFNVNLDNRKYSLATEPGNKEITLTFYEKNNVFGWLERLPLAKFFEKLTELNLYINFK